MEKQHSRKITINASCPGFVATDMNAAMLQDERGGQFGTDDSIFGRGEEPKRPYDVLRLPAFHLRTMGQPVDIADIAAFLASDGKALDYRAADRASSGSPLEQWPPLFYIIFTEN